MMNQKPQVRAPRPLKRKLSTAEARKRDHNRAYLRRYYEKNCEKFAVG